MNHSRHHWASATLAALALALPAHSVLAQGAAKSAQFYEDALTRYEKKDFTGAVVQLKNVLKLDNKNLSAQVLLGKALLEDGQVAAAEVAFNEALRLGVNRAEVVVLLARTMINQGKPDDVLSGNRFSLDGLPKPVQYQLYLQRAAAATDFTDIKAAQKAIEDARALDAADTGSWLAEVPVRIRAGQKAEALAAADKAISLAPNSAGGHLARAEALHIVPNLTDALASYNKVLAIDPLHVSALLARAGISLDLGKNEEAARDVAAALKQAPREPRAVYLKALVAERQGRPAEARAALNELTGMLDPIPVQNLRYRPQTQMLGGMAHYGLGQREKAKPYLEGVLRSQPGHPVSKVLATIYLSERGFDAAISTLETYIKAHPRDTQAMVQLASAHTVQGRHARASQILQEALKVSDQPDIRTSLGLSLVGGGRFQEAIKELETILAKDPRQLSAGFSLASLYLQSGQTTKALRTASALAKAHPKNAGIQNLLANAHARAGDLAAARSALEAAVLADPGFLTPQVTLARMDMNSGAAPKAAERLNALFAKNDRDLEVLAAIAELSERTGKFEDAKRWLEKADDVAGADNPAPALALVEFQLRQKQPALAAEAARRAQAKAPEAIATLVALARTSLTNGDAASARASLLRAATNAGFNAPQLTQIAFLQVQAGATPAAAHSLDKALSDRSDYVPALALRAEIDMGQGELAKAEQRARQVLSLIPKGSIGHVLLGDIASARGQREAALAAYRKAHDLDRSTASLMRLYAFMAPRDQSGALKLGEQWVAANPRDVTVQRALADTHLNAGNTAAARRGYDALLKLTPNDVDVLNNLAHALISLKDPAALPTAERALALAPTAAHVIGTAGWASFKAGQQDRAVQLLRDARLRDPANPETRFYLGTVLASLGRKAEAREELTAALAASRGLNSRAEAGQLLTSLK